MKNMSFKHALIIFISVTVLYAGSKIFYEVIPGNGASMYPSFDRRENLKVIKMPFYGELERNDVILFTFDDTGKRLFKRVIGLPQETINIQNGSMYVSNDEEVLKYTTQNPIGGGDIEYPMNIKEDTYFVVGDNHANSIDSRKSRVGLVEKENIVGKVIKSTKVPYEIELLDKVPSLLEEGINKHVVDLFTHAQTDSGLEVYIDTSNPSDYEFNIIYSDTLGDENKLGSVKGYEINSSKDTINKLNDFLENVDSKLKSRKFYSDGINHIMFYLK